MVIKETSVFTRLIKEMMGDRDYNALQLSLVANPTQGAVIRGSGGLRKMRWSDSSKGKRGGFRLIYYYLSCDNQVLMIYLYKKNHQSDLTQEQLKQLKQVVEEELKNES